MCLLGRGMVLLALSGLLSRAAAAAPATVLQQPQAPPSACDQGWLQTIPARAAAAPTGHEFAQQILPLSGAARDAVIRSQLLAGNMPRFLRHLLPVSILSRDTAQPVELTVCVLPDYLAVGSDRDFVFVPLGLQAALEVAAQLGFMLPTPKLVDAIYRQSSVKLAPLALPAGNEMRSTAYFVRHSDLIARQRTALQASVGELTAGHKKDLVLSSRLWDLPGRIAIYGWHRDVDEPVQPLNSWHGARYADYSHGVRLVSDTVYVNGVPRAMEEVLADASLAPLMTAEGPWAEVAERLGALMTRLRESPTTW